MSFIKKAGKIIVPSAKLRGLIINLFMNLSRLLKIPYEKYLILTVGKKQQKALKKVKKKEKIKVAFFVIHASVWKYDLLYQLFKENDRFDPVVVICPYINQGIDTMYYEMNLAFDVFTKKRYNVVKSYKEATGEWLDVKKQIDPDIIFFTNPHKLTRDQYYIGNYIDRLTCYVPYSFQVSNLYEMQYNQLFHNLLWKAFYETKIHEEIAKKYSKNRGKNVVVTGYPGVDIFNEKYYKPAEDVWKIKNRNIKRIIWAPHHTIDEDSPILNYSTFLFYAEFMLDIAMKYNERLQIAFKPHPLLKSKLESDKYWGKTKTNDYYQKWNTLDNGQLNEADYVDLFLSSDALIHDSGSFLAEYLATGKPALFIMHDEQVSDRFNDFGKMAFEEHYHARSKEDIISFIENTVISGDDSMKTNRKSFIKKYMLSSNGNSSSMNILSKIKLCVE